MDPWEPFKTPQAAARDFGQHFADDSRRLNREFAAVIFTMDGSRAMDGSIEVRTYAYVYVGPECINGGACNMDIPVRVPAGGRTAVAIVHIHDKDRTPHDEKEYETGEHEYDFSPRDKSTTKICREKEGFL